MAVARCAALRHRLDASTKDLLVQKADARASISVFDYAALLRQCGNAKTLLEGKRIHEHASTNGRDRETFLGNLLVQMYGNCGHPEEAYKAFGNITKKNVFSWNIMLTTYAQNGHLQNAKNMFEQMAQRDVVSWNAMLSAYAQVGHIDEALEVFGRMESADVQPNKLTFISALDAFSSSDQSYLAMGQILHDKIAHREFHFDIKIQTALLNMYGKCGSVETARTLFVGMKKPDVVAYNAMVSVYAQNGHLHNAKTLFDKMQVRNLVTWNIMISASLHNGDGRMAVELFQLMDLEGVQADRIIFITVLYACGTAADLELGKLIHAEILDCGLDTDVAVGTALVSMYGKCRCIQDSQNAFEKIADRNQVSWNAMISAYTQNGHFQDARSMFDTMPKPDVVSWTVMMAAYTQNGYVQEAKDLFDRMLHRDVASWNVMIAAYAENGQSREALELLKMMDLEGAPAGRITFVSVLAGQLPLAEARIVQGVIASSGLQSDGIVGTALVNMHGRSGRLDDARDVFNLMPELNVVSWTAMIGAYAQNGHGKVALELFHAMNLEGVQPNEITFISIVSACSHAGLLADGRQYFHSIERDYGMIHTKDHYMCMTDLFGRSGQLEQAEELLNNIPFRPDYVAWLTLLSACRVHGSTVLGGRVAERAFELDPSNPAPYILLSNIYAEAGETDAALRVRKMMEDRNVRKEGRKEGVLTATEFL